MERPRQVLSSTVGRLALLVGLCSVVSSVGCLLDSTATGVASREYHCEAVVRNAAGHLERAQSGDDEFGDRRVFGYCPAGASEGRDLQWRRHLAEVLSAGPFRDHANGWCVQAANCRESVLFDASRPDCPVFPATLEPAPLCPDSPPDCVIGTPEPRDFPPTPLGESAPPETIAYENTCDEEIPIFVDETVLGDRDEEFTVVANDCAYTVAVDGHLLTAYGTADDGCSVTFEYTPKNPGLTEVEFSAPVGGELAARIRLRGEGIGGDPHPVADTLDYCVEPGIVDCATVEIGVVSDGPGGFRLVDEADLDRSNGEGFELLAAGRPARDEVFAVGVPAVFQVEWCRSRAAEAEEKATLSVTTTTSREATDTLIFNINAGGCL